LVLGTELIYWDEQSNEQGRDFCIWFPSVASGIRAEGIELVQVEIVVGTIRVSFGELWVSGSMQYVKNDYEGGGETAGA